MHEITIKLRGEPWYPQSAQDSVELRYEKLPDRVEQIIQRTLAEKKTATETWFKGLWYLDKRVSAIPSKPIANTPFAVAIALLIEGPSDLCQAFGETVGSYISEEFGRKFDYGGLFEKMLPVTVTEK